MTALVTGATGFIGRHLVDALAASGQEVRCLTRGKPQPDPRPGVSVHQANFDRPDLGLTDDVLRRLDVVYHLAGATRAVSATEFRRANVAVVEALLDRLSSLGGKPRFVMVSSQAAAGPARDAGHPKREEDPDAPIEDYGRSKLAAERLVQARGSMPFTILRPVAVYGPGDRDFLSIFAMAKRGISVFPGIRDSVVNTVYVGDVVAGMIAAARSNVAAGESYFLGDDTPQPWKSIYATIGEIVGQPRPVEISIPHGVVSLAGAIGDFVGIVSGRPSLVNRNKAVLAAPKYWLCTSARARADFGFVTPTSLREGMRATYDWYVQHRWL